jgi:hypothetical protein
MIRSLKTLRRDVIQILVLGDTDITVASNIHLLSQHPQYA